MNRTSRMLAPAAIALLVAAGAASGGGHYTVAIVAAAFTGKSRVARHRLVYDALGNLMQQQIHALALTTHAPDEV